MPRGRAPTRDHAGLRDVDLLGKYRLSHVTISSPPRRLALLSAGSGPSSSAATSTRRSPGWRGCSSDRLAAAAAARSSGAASAIERLPNVPRLGAEIGISHDQAHGVDRHSELRSAGARPPAVALTDVDLAGQGGDCAVGVDMEPGTCAGRRRLGLGGGYKAVRQDCEPVALGDGSEIPRLCRAAERRLWLS